MISNKTRRQEDSKNSRIESEIRDKTNLNGYQFYLLYVVCFLAGGLIMTLEMLGFRMLAPYFGYSIYVWGSLIGIIMAALSCGYIIGGTLADRFPRPSVLYGSIFFAGLYTAVIGFLYRPILLFCQSLGLISGSISATILLFAAPMILLSMVSPFVIRLLAKKNKIGTTAGRIYSLSTVGSIFGTFLASFFLIPALGSHKTLIIAVIMLFLISIGGLALSKSKFALLCLILAPVIWNYPDPPHEEKTVYAKESPYSHVEVVKFRDWLCLKPQDNFYHSFYHPRRIMTRGVWDYYCLGPLILKDAQNALVLGMGGGTSVRQFLHFWKDLQIDAVEIDPVIVKIANEMFELPQDSPNLNVIIDDARVFLQRNTTKTYDVIEIDIFQGGVFIPFYLATQEFFSLCKTNLKPGGLMIMNVNISRDWDEGQTESATLFGSIGNTISAVFPSVFYIKLRSGNAIVLAFNEDMSFDNLTALMKNADTKHWELKRLLAYSIAKVKAYKKQNNSQILTDDFSPLAKLAYPIAIANFKPRADARRQLGN